MGAQDYPGPGLCLLVPGLLAVLQLLSHVLFGTSWTAACQASLSITIS